MTRQFHFLTLCLCFSVSINGYSQKSNSFRNQWQFSTDFKGVQVNQDSYRIESTSPKKPSAFDKHLTKEQGTIAINYETKKLEAAKAEVVDAPELDGKRALRFWTDRANVYQDGKPLKTRIQLNLAKNPGFRSFVSEVSVYLPPAMDELNQCPKPITWLTLQEFWNALHGDHKTTFRISVGLWKSKHGRLHFGFKAQDYIGGKYIDVERGDDESAIVPTGQWFRLRTEVKEGSCSNGFFRLTLISEGQETVLYERTMQTMATVICEGRYPRKGFNSLQPLKLYTPAWLTDWMRARGHAIEAYFTDWSFWER